MKFLLYSFLIINLSSCQLFNGLPNVNTINTYTVPSSIMNPGFDSFNNNINSQNQITENFQPQRFIQDNLANSDTESVTNELSNGLETVLDSQAQNLISEQDKKTSESEPTQNQQNFGIVENSEINNMTVKDLNIQDHLKIAGNVIIEKNGVRVTNESSLFFGNETFSVGKLLEMVKFAEKIRTICGENFEKCNPEQKKVGADENIKKFQTKSKFRLKQRGNRFLQTNNQKKIQAKQEGDISEADIANNSIDLETQEKEKEVEAAVEKVMDDEFILNNHGNKNSEEAI